MRKRETQSEQEREWQNETGKRLYNLRNERQWTLDTLSKQCRLMYGVDVNKGTWSKYERGESEPSLTKLRLLAGVYGVSLDYLLGLTDKRTGKQNNVSQTELKLTRDQITLLDAFDKATDDQKRTIRYILRIKSTDKDE